MTDDQKQSIKVAAWVLNVRTYHGRLSEVSAVKSDYIHAIRSYGCSGEDKIIFLRDEIPMFLEESFLDWCNGAVARLNLRESEMCVNRFLDKTDEMCSKK